MQFARFRNTLVLSIKKRSMERGRKELSALLIARKTLKDISGGTLGKEISSILNKITNILTKHNMKEDAIDGTFSFQMVEYSPSAENTFQTVGSKTR